MKKDARTTKPIKRPTKPRDKWKIWLIALFGIYVGLLVWLVLFKLDFYIPYRNRGINWIPFDLANAANRHFSYRETIANVIAFIPFGGYLAMLGVRKRWVVPIGTSLSLFFELTQYAFNMGIADVTDLITNTLGTAIGFGVYCLLCVIFRKHRVGLNRTLTILATTVTVPSAAFFVWALAVALRSI